MVTTDKVLTMTYLVNDLLMAVLVILLRELVVFGAEIKVLLIRVGFKRLQAVMLYVQVLKVLAITLLVVGAVAVVGAVLLLLILTLVGVVGLLLIVKEVLLLIKVVTIVKKLQAHYVIRVTPTIKQHVIGLIL